MAPSRSKAFPGRIIVPPQFPVPMTEGMTMTKERAPLSPTRRALLTGLGLISTGAGIVGIVLPVMPTTIFLIIASALFLKAHPRLYTWLHRNKVLGAYLDAYTEKRGLPMRHKITTIAVLWVTIGISEVMVQALWLRLFLAAVAIGVTIHVSLLKTRRPDSEVDADGRAESPTGPAAFSIATGQPYPPDAKKPLPAGGGAPGAAAIRSE